MAVKKNNKEVKVIALITFVVILYVQFVWLIVANTKGLTNQNDKVNAFLHYFPSFIKNISEITYITLLFAAIATLSSVKWKNKSKGFDNVFAIIIMSLSIVIGLMTLFQLM